MWSVIGCACMRVFGYILHEDMTLMWCSGRWLAVAFVESEACECS